MKQEKITALLPMKSHSERVPNKNIKNIAGKPLYRWILDKLLSIKGIDTIIINTDSEEILSEDELNNDEKIILRRRKQELRGDFVSMNNILEDDIKAIESDLYLMTHSTNPLLSKVTIQRALTEYTMNSKKYDSLFSVTKYQTRFYHKNGKAINHNPDNLVRTQDLDPYYEENSCLYIFTKDSFYKKYARIGAKPLLFETPKIESIDIDDNEDWLIAESLIEYFSSHNIKRGENE